MVRRLTCLFTTLALVWCASAHAKRDGVLDSEEIHVASWFLLNFGKPKAVAANDAIVKAYAPQLNGSWQPLADYVATNASFIESLQATHEANQARLVEYVAKETVYGYGVAEGSLDDLWAEVYDPIVAYVEGAKTDPQLINLFDSDECEEDGDDSDCIELEVNDLLADMCRNALTVFPALQKFQVAPETGAQLNGTDGTDILVSRGDSILWGGPGVDAFVVGWVGHMVIEDFEPEDKIVFPSDFFGDTLQEILWHLSSFADRPDGLHVEFYNGAVQITFRNVHTVDAFQVLALDS